MKKLVLPILLAAAIGFGFAQETRGVDENRQQKCEYATIRWGGREHTHVIRPGSHVEFVGDQLARLTKPDQADNRAFYMNAVLNAMAREGYEFVGTSGDDFIMKRPIL